MTSDAAALDGALRRSALLALACALVWSVGALSANWIGIWRGVGATAVVLGAAIVVVEGRSLRGLLRPASRELALGLLAAAGMIAATYLLFPVLVSLAPALLPQFQALYRTLRAASPWEVALVLPLVVTAEELVWRGLVQRVIAGRTGPVAAVVLGALAYAVAHAPVGSPALVAVALACGLCWGALFALTGSLAATVICHGAWDLVVMILRPLA